MSSVRRDKKSVVYGIKDERSNFESWESGSGEKWGIENGELGIACEEWGVGSCRLGKERQRCRTTSCGNRCRVVGRRGLRAAYPPYKKTRRLYSNNYREPESGIVGGLVVIVLGCPVNIALVQRKIRFLVVRKSPRLSLIHQQNRNSWRVPLP
jgi:hypothetical protein